MPKREDARPAVQSPKPQQAAKVTQEEISPVEEVEVSQADLLFTESEMMDMETETLKEILTTVYGVDPSSKPGVNSNKKIRGLILDQQAEYAKKGKPLPVAVLAYKKKLEAKTSNPLPAAPVAVATVEQKMVRTVAYEVAATINTNNYENVKVSARVELPINPTQQDLADAQATMLQARELVFGQVNQEITLVRNTMTNP